MRYAPDAYDATGRPHTAGPAAPAPMTRHDGSPIEVLVVATDEERAIAEATASLVRERVKA